MLACMSAPPFDTILTLEARSNILLEVITEYFNLTESQVFHEIRSNASRLRQLLRRKGIEYLDLQHALVPTTDRADRAFLFDWTKFSDAWYGGQVMHCLLPALDKRSLRSILAGDWIARLRPQAALREPNLPLEPPAGVDRVQQLPDTLYVVYLNNLTRPMVSAIDTAFAVLPAYVGSLDMTYTSLFKVLLSGMLVRDFVQYKDVALMGHEDDRDDDEDYALKRYDFTGFGYKVRSVPSALYGMLLSYKIERPVFDFDLGDSQFSLNAMTPTPRALIDCEVVVEPAKLGYLQANKASSLKRAGLAGLDGAAVAERIRKKLTGNYIYNLAYSESFSALKFNIVLENDKIARSMCSLKYVPQEQRVKVITFF
jgi:hypothetical protein